MSAVGSPDVQYLDRTTTRRVPVLGGLNPTLLRLEVRRLLRNRRTVIFTLIMPPVFFLIFGTQKAYRHDSAGQGNVTAYIAVSMAIYGAMLACTAGGASVSVERAQGWSRQLRLTPLEPVAYILAKALVAVLMGLASVVTVFVVAAFSGAKMPLHVWVECGLVALLGSLVFAAFGLFMGYLLPAENVMQVLGPVLAVLAFAGGLFVPLDHGSVFATLSHFTPLYGLATLGRMPLASEGDSWAALLNIVVWGGVFVTGAAWRFRRDTARV